MLQERRRTTDLSYKVDKNKFFFQKKQQRRKHKINYNKNYTINRVFSIFKTLDANNSIDNIIFLKT